MRIRTKISLFAVSLVAAVVASIVVNLILVEKRRARAEFEARVGSLLDGVRRIARESLASQDEVLLMSYLKFLMRDYPEVEVAMITRKDHTSLIGEVKTELFYRTVSVSERPQPELSKNRPSRRSAGVAAPNEFSIELGFSKTLLDQKVREAQWELTRKILSTAGVGLVIGMLGALWLGALLSKPLASLADAAERIGAGRLDTVVDASARDEIGNLASHFNRMAGRLQEFIRFKEDLLSTLSHELTTPLSGLKGFLEYLTEAGPGQSAKDRHESYRTMSEAIKQMEISLGNALALFKGDQAEELHPERVSPRSVVVEVLRLFAPTAQVNGITLAGPMGDGRAELYADKEMLRRLAINLISNAIKFTPPGGTVTISLKDSPDEAVLSVADTGPGIAPEYRDHIFTKFYRVPPSGGREQRIPGSGLGLAIAKHAADLQGGRIWLDSAVGKGSTFHVSIPRKGGGFR